VFVDVSALERILTERRQERAETLLGALGDSVAHEIGKAYAGHYRMLPQPEGPVYVKCPDCEKVMSRRQFAAGAGVIVDVCRDHGTWFDAHELPQVIDFAMRGGLERAQRRAEEEARERRRQEKARSMSISPGDAPWAARELPARDVGLGALLGSVLGALGKLLSDR
jgi:Zn-finger nucleic acid-binding protein